MQILSQGIDHDDALMLEPVANKEDIIAMIDAASQTTVHPDVLHYITTIIRATRSRPGIELGVSPRGGLALKKASQAWAYMSGRDFVTPGDVKATALMVLGHRIMSADADPRTVIEALLHEIKVPS
jgi:MoxR-like ATPase